MSSPGTGKTCGVGQEAPRSSASLSCARSPQSAKPARPSRPAKPGYETLCDFQALYAAHTKARRSKMRKREVIDFELDLGANLARLRAELLSQTYRIGGYAHFVVSDPKRRDVHAPRYRDRVVQHALCAQVLAPVLEPRLVYDNAAARVGKGTHFALDRLAGFMREHYRRHGTQGYLLKFDVRHYYASIDHAILRRLFDGYLAHDERLRWLVGLIIDSYEEAPGKGIPLGNQASSWFAVSYLDGLDRLIKERLRLKHYTRYMDDGVVVHSDRDHLRDCLAQMRAYLDCERALTFNEKTQIVPLSQGVDYLGFHLYLSETGKVVRRLRASNKRSTKRKLKRFRHAYRVGKISAEDVAESVQSYRAHLAHGDCWRLERTLLSHLTLSRSTQAELAWDREHPEAALALGVQCLDAATRGVEHPGAAAPREERPEAAARDGERPEGALALGVECPTVTARDGERPEAAPGMAPRLPVPPQADDLGGRDESK